MKKHAIIPIFIPHRGCKNDCVFCNQRVITARDGSITPQGARDIIETYLPTLQGRGLDTIEVSFFGGSFTGIPIEEQTAFLEVAKEYKDKGLIDKIHLSTRPDYIDKVILDNLRKYSVDVIELGVQSFSPQVLLASRRGHSIDCVYKACDLIKQYGFMLGIQLMVGLPCDTYEHCMHSVAETIKIAPSLARIYPTVVISDTHLYDMYKDGTYKPFEEAEMIRTVKDMYKALTKAGINVMRVGLKSTALMNSDSDYVACGYHPAFRELIEGSIARDVIEEKVSALLANDIARNGCRTIRRITINAPEEMLSIASGHQGVNKKYFAEKWPEVQWSFAKTDGADTGYNCIKVTDITKTTVYISKDANDELVSYLNTNVAGGCKVIKVRPHADVGEAISKHPDIYMCDLGDELYMGDASKLSSKYPGDVLYNAARVGKYFICSKYTDADLKEKAIGKGLELVEVPQGYVKCNLAVLDAKHVITEDQGIAKALEKTDIKVLLVNPKHVALPGYAHGFIGGCCGVIKDELVFHGDISKHTDFEKIESFSNECELTLKYFDFPLTDIGSIIAAY